MKTEEEFLKKSTALNEGDEQTRPGIQRIFLLNLSTYDRELLPTKAF